MSIDVVPPVAAVWLHAATRHPADRRLAGRRRLDTTRPGLFPRLTSHSSAEKWLRRCR